jgi:hypothetical protein
MITPSNGGDVTVRDVVNGLEAMEKWTRELRDALATLDQEQRLAAGQKPKPAVPLVSGGRCPPPPDPVRQVKKDKKKKKKK